VHAFNFPTKLPLADQPLICVLCPNLMLGTGEDGRAYCHLCRDWKMDRIRRHTRLLMMSPWAIGSAVRPC
jgi:hypothetical protein